MVLKLYGSPFSNCTKRVATILWEKQVPFELHHVNMQGGEHKSPAFVEKQPFGVVPYLDDDGFILYESRAIAIYIATKYSNQGTPLVPEPTDLIGQALLNQAISAELSNFNIWALLALTENVFKPKYYGQPGNPEAFKTYISELETKLDGYEKILAKSKYVAGDKLTVVDLFFLPFGDLLKVAGSDVLESPARPNVKRWFEEIRSRKSWQANQDTAKAYVEGGSDA